MLKKLKHGEIVKPAVKQNLFIVVDDSRENEFISC